MPAKQGLCSLPWLSRAKNHGMQECKMTQIQLQQSSHSTTQFREPLFFSQATHLRRTNSRCLGDTTAQGMVHADLPRLRKVKEYHGKLCHSATAVGELLRAFFYNNFKPSGAVSLHHGSTLCKATILSPFWKWLRRLRAICLFSKGSCDVL